MIDVLRHANTVSDAVCGPLNEHTELTLHKGSIPILATPAAVAAGIAAGAGVVGGAVAGFVIEEANDN